MLWPRILALLEAEVGDAYLGGSLVTQRLAEILMIEAIRAYADAGSAHRVGWIAALADAKIGAALRLMHGDVARPWDGQRRLRRKSGCHARPSLNASRPGSAGRRWTT